MPRAQGVALAVLAEAVPAAVVPLPSPADLQSLARLGQEPPVALEQAGQRVHKTRIR